MSYKLKTLMRRTPIALAVSSAMLFSAGAAQAQLGGLLGGVLPSPPSSAPCTPNGDGTCTDANGQTQGPIPAQQAAGYARNGAYAAGGKVQDYSPGSGNEVFTDSEPPYPENTFGYQEPNSLVLPPSGPDPAQALNLGTLRVGTLLEVDLPDVGGALFGPGTKACSSAPLVGANLGCLVDRVMHATGVNILVAHQRIGTFTPLSANVAGLLDTIAGNGLLPGAGPNPAAHAPEAHYADGTIIKNGSVLVGWAGDEIYDDGVADSDLVYVVDLEPESTTYGHVIWTAGLPSYLLGDQINNGQLRYTTDNHNDPHHANTYNQFVDKDGRKLMFTGGLLSANMFRFDITDPRAIKTATMAFCGGELARSSLADDIFVMPQKNPETGQLNMIASYMNGIANAGPGTLIEFSPYRQATCAGGAPYNGSNPDQYLAEHTGAKVGGPKRNRPNEITGNTDTGLEFYPHGVWPTADGKYIASSDYAVSALIGVGQPTSTALDALFPARPNLETVPGIGSLGEYGTTVRLWDAKDLSKGPISISQVPDGPRVEGTYFHEEDQGLMPFSELHKPSDRGAFVGSMCGGVLYYTPDIRASVEAGHPAEWHAVWDSGPCTSLSVFQVTPDDHFVMFPLSGTVSPGDPVYERDYVGEHDRRINVVDVSKLTAKQGPNAEIHCSFPDADPTRPGNSTLGLQSTDIGQPVKDTIYGRVHNNGADDCPTLVGQIVTNSPEGYASFGGAHYTHFDRTGSKSVNLDTIPWRDDPEWQRYCLREIDPDTGVPVMGGTYTVEPWSPDENGFVDPNEIDQLQAEHRLGLKPYCRAGWSQYFVDVSWAGIQGTASVGDKKLYIANFNPVTGEIVLDVNFRDEVTGEVGLNMANREGFNWPNRGVTGGIRPHAFTIEYKGAYIKAPYEVPDVPETKLK